MHFLMNPFRFSLILMGHFDLLKTSMIIPDLNKNIFGYEISNIQSEIELNPDVLAISNMSIDLENSKIRCSRKLYLFKSSLF